MITLNFSCYGNSVQTCGGESQVSVYIVDTGRALTEIAKTFKLKVPEMVCVKSTFCDTNTLWYHCCGKMYWYQKL